MRVFAPTEFNIIYGGRSQKKGVGLLILSVAYDIIKSMKNTAWMVLAGGLNQGAKYEGQKQEPVGRVLRQSVEQWNGREWVTRILTWNEETGRYE